MSTGMKAVNSVNCSACGLCLQSSLLLLRSEIKVILKMQMHLFCYKVNNRRDKAHLSALPILSELSSLSLPSLTFPPGVTILLHFCWFMMNVCTFFFFHISCFWRCAACGPVLHFLLLSECERDRERNTANFREFMLFFRESLKEKRASMF